MFDQLAKSVFEAVAGSQADKDRVQEQLKPVLEQRFKPCLELWPRLWTFVENAEPGDKDIDDVSKAIGDFLRDQGALLSIAFFDALFELRTSLRDAKTGDDLARSVKVDAIKSRNLLPSTFTDAGGNKVPRPGVLLLLRDEIGSNARSASSALKN